MPYELIFSRNRSNDSPVVFGDVGVSDASIMVDALSVLSRFRRSAGWLYPARPAGNNTFERGKGVLILFGKNRVNFPDFTPPYYLEFFPRFGVGAYILSFYKGSPDTPRPSSVTIPVVGTQLFRSSVDGRIFAAVNASSPFVPIAGTSGSLSARISADRRLFIQFPSSSFALSTGSPWILVSTNNGQWTSAGNGSGSLAVPSVAQ